MVLDGAVDVNAPLTQQADEQAPAAEQSLAPPVRHLPPSAACPLGTDPRAFFPNAGDLAHRPSAARARPRRHTPVTVGDLDTATLFDLSVPVRPLVLPGADARPEPATGAPLRTLALGFATDIDGAPLVDPQWAIICNDAASHPGPVAAGNQARALSAGTPSSGPTRSRTPWAVGGLAGGPANRSPTSTPREHHRSWSSATPAIPTPP